MLLIKLQVVLLNITYLAKLQYFTNLDFPEIAGDFPSKTLPLGGPKTRALGAHTCAFPKSFHSSFSAALHTSKGKNLVHFLICAATPGEICLPCTLGKARPPQGGRGWATKLETAWAKTLEAHHESPTSLPKSNTYD